MKALQKNVEFAERARFVKELIVVDGITRTGKFMAAHVVAAMEGVEYMQYPYLLETLLYMYRLGKIDFETCMALLHVEIDFNTYAMMIGRGLNGRLSDLSCIHKAVESQKFLDRATSGNEDDLIARWIEEKRLPLYIGHEGLCNARLMFDIFPELKVINMLRDPVALISSWYKRGLGARWGTDPKVFSTPFKGKTGPVPWFAVNWEEDYRSLSEMDRIVKSIASLNKMGRQEYEECSKEVKARILFVTFEALTEQTDDETKRISKFMGRKPLHGINAVLERERLPRPALPDQRLKQIKEILPHLSSGARPLLDQLVTEYDEYWRPIVQGEADA